MADVGFTFSDGKTVIKSPSGADVEMMLTGLLVNLAQVIKTVKIGSPGTAPIWDANTGELTIPRGDTGASQTRRIVTTQAAFDAAVAGPLEDVVLIYA